MTAKRWFIMLICTVLLVALVIASINICIDPFGVFGDRFMGWYSYNMTNNPKTAKFTYIDQRKGSYDAFIVGPSGASGFSPALLEKYTGLRWYNAFNYGADMEYTKRLSAYLIENHQPKHLLLCVPVVSASAYATPVEEIGFRQPLKPYWKLPFYFANPKYSLDKIKNSFKKSYLQKSFDVFDPVTGTYNKSRRDAEAVGSLEEYLTEYPEFLNVSGSVDLEYIDECILAIAEIKALCERSGTKLTVATCPMLTREMNNYDFEEVKEFYEKLAKVSEFWDFTLSSVSTDPRYFYDATHFRNSVGEMMISRIFGDDSIYIPDNLGVLITPENASAIVWAEPAQDLHTRDIPILMYHNIAESGDESVTVSPSQFEGQMSSLYETGYSAISLYELQDYVFKGIEPPEKSVVITFDDGYLSNYSIAYPILKKYNFNATIFVIGVSFGNDTYKDTGIPSIPHFDADQAQEMIQSGLITIQSHTHDLHQVEGLDDNPRNGVLRMDGESEESYITALRGDYAQLALLVDEKIFALSYPHGLSDELSRTVLRECGISITFSTENGIATFIKGLPQSLLEIKRLNVVQEMTGEQLINMIEDVN